MKNIFLIILLLLSNSNLFSQINLGGNTEYRLTIAGYVDIPSSACGDIFGLRSIKVKYKNGNIKTVWSGREYLDSFEHKVSYNESNVITEVIFNEINRWKETLGCNGGPSYIETPVTLNNTCFNLFKDRVGHRLYNVLIDSRPITSIEKSTDPLYLDEISSLNINLPNNISTKYYNWKFKVGNGAIQTIPYSYNNKNILNIKGSDFLKDSDFGKTISVWLETNCNITDNFAVEIAKIYSLKEASAIRYQCYKKYIFAKKMCDQLFVQNLPNLYTKYYTQDLRDEYYQPSNSNVIQFTYLKGAPHITSVETKDISCFEEEDGSVKINFDRDLLLNEDLSINIVNLDNEIDVDKDGNPIYEVAWSQANAILEPDMSFTFSKNIGKGLKNGKFRVQLLGFINGASTFTDGITHEKDFNIAEPIPVEFTTSQTNAWCNGGSDGTITIKAKGGQFNKKYKYLLRKTSDTSPVQERDWKEFTSLATPSGTFPNVLFEATEIITSKPAGNYTIKIKDANNCIAKEIIKDGGGAIIGLGSEIAQPVEITEPAEPVKIDFVYEKQPTAFGFSDGQIRAQITGGTPLANDKYNFTWKHENGTTWTTFSDDNTDPSQGWFLTLENAIQGTYTLTVTDVNYSSATNKEGCTVVNASYTLNEPSKLTLRVEETNPISCNSTNIYSDPSSDGELTAIASGGVPFSPLIQGKYAYKYTWKKKNSSGVYQILSGEKGDVLKNQAAGEYAVNIEDANGILIGTYTNNIITSLTDIKYTLEQPPLLQINYAKQDVFCYQGTDGAINTIITGGTGAYTISWNTGETTKDIVNLKAGVYTIQVTDERGCKATQIITIEEPENPIEINYNFFEPTFAGATNGWIEATVTGGTPLNDGSYTYIWKDASGNNLNTQVTTQVNASSYVLKLNGIGEGTYRLAIQDKNYPLATDKINCTVVESQFTIDDPEPLLAAIKLKTPISCNSTNIYGDPFSDGALEVIAEGGVKLQPHENNGLLYYYTWKKETSPGVWTLLTAQNTNIASGLDAGNYAVNIEDANGIILGVYEHNVLVTPTDVTYNFEEPPLLELAFEKQDVYCYEGSDGWAKAIIKGGVPPYIIQWGDGTSVAQINNLPKGEYTVGITDARGCQVSGSIQVKQPQAPISINFSAFATPTTGGASDGWIEAQIEGGTSFTDGSYTYFWQDESGAILNTQTTTSSVTGKFQIRLSTIKKGRYYLTIQDANYTNATTKVGCTTADNEFIVYDPIEAIITVETPISCNQNNNFNNPFADGKLKATITGGLPFSLGQSYTYYWKKKNASGVYEDINQNNPVASNLSTGDYALNVEDSRGIVIGVYESLQLTTPTDVLYTFEEPALLSVSLSATEISCDTGNNGTATVTIEGGIPPYNIQWSNGAITSTAINLIAGNHLVFVTDARGCQVTGNITIDEPGGIKIAVTKINPTCYKGNDGTISLAISGGVAPYVYSWNTGETATNLSGLSEGTYFFSLEDANGCKTFREVKLENPEQINIDLGADKTVCKDQEYVLDGGIDDLGASYSWGSDNGFTSNEKTITVTKGGTYTVTATSSKGCTATDSVIVTYSNNEIDAEFLMSSQAYINEEVVLFHTSNPKPDTFEWNLPPEAVLVKKEGNTLVLRFTEPNTYEVGLSVKVGDCIQELTKNIVIEESEELPNPGDTDDPFIIAFNISPNPNTGNFKTTINLVESSPISLRIFNAYGGGITKSIPQETLEEYNLPFDMQLASGMYVVVLETAKQTQVKRMVVK
ncbi:T9SS type A sorting domain-containing protein [Tenacibaculum ovolyticum]|uniref:T9SS type A sorting domain-containing protein n=1 Tax=Tenacibaculum ovolyticum TaxID=104270 RepID=UPI003BAB2735